jgi:Rrf2 family protein
MKEPLGISTAANIAIHAVAFLVGRGSSEPCSTLTIAEGLQVSQSHLRKIMQVLCKEGFVTSIRGAYGGYRVQAEMGSLPILSVIEAIDGPLGAPPTRHHNAVCHIEDCALAQANVEVGRLLVARLGSLTIDALVQACTPAQLSVAHEPGASRA